MVAWRNQADRFGLVAVLLHWSVALTVFGMFGLGLWMVELDYYDAWYRSAPDLHRSLGACLFVVLLFRLLWRCLSPVPPALATHKPWELRLAAAAHLLLYLLPFAIMISGYLVSTADGRSLSVFGVVDIPSITGRIPNLEDTAGWLHKLMAWSLIGLVMLHAAGALKHHFIDRDATLRRMFGRS